MNKPFITFLKKSQSRVKICIGLCLALIFSICSGSLNTYADSTYYETSGTFYVLDRLGGIHSENYSVITTIEDDHAYLCEIAIYDELENLLTRYSGSNYVDSDNDDFQTLSKLWYQFNVGGQILTWCRDASFKSCGFQLVRLDNGYNEDEYRLCIYFFRNDTNDTITVNNGYSYISHQPSFILFDDSSYIFPYGACIGYSINNSTGSFYNVPLTFDHRGISNSSISSSFENNYPANWIMTLDGEIYYQGTDYTWPNLTDFNNRIIVYDFYLGPYYRTQISSNLCSVFVNCFPRYTIGNSELFAGTTYEIEDIMYGSLGPITRFTSGISVANSNNQSYFITTPNTNIVYSTNQYVIPSSQIVTPEPSPSGSPIVTDEPLPTIAPPVTLSPQYTQIPYYTQAPYYTQMPYPTQEPYYTQMPYPTQEPYYTQMPYPTQRPYYTQIPYPSGLNDLGELTDKLLTPMPNPTGSDLQYYDFDLDSVNINLNNDLTNSQSKNFFFAFISILWDKMNLLCFGYFALALGLIFIWYLLGHGRRG